MNARNGNKGCDRCRLQRALRGMPHCCRCTCIYHTIANEMRKSQSIPECKPKMQRGMMQSLSKIPTRPIRNSGCDLSSVSSPFSVFVTEIPSCPRVEKAKCRPPERPTGPISEYRLSYKPPKCTGPKHYPDTDPMAVEHRAPWDKSTRPLGQNCRVTLASNEAKLAALDQLLGKYQQDCAPCDPKPKPISKKKRNQKDPDVFEEEVEDKPKK